MIWHTKEGGRCRQGLNWRRSSDTSLGLVLKLWRFNWYLRLRAKHLCEDSNFCKRFIFSFSYRNYKDDYEQIFSGLFYNWNLRTFKYGKTVVTEELLADFIETIGSRDNDSATGIDYFANPRGLK
jgi:hypothetical protein